MNKNLYQAHEFYYCWLCDQFVGWLGLGAYEYLFYSSLIGQ